MSVVDFFNNSKKTLQLKSKNDRTEENSANCEVDAGDVFAERLNDLSFYV